jgi:uncharacterized repeat protein (TIGR01451 family)
VSIGFDGFTSVANQGSVSGTNFNTVLTDDPDTPAANDPTVTPVLTIIKEGPVQTTTGSIITYTGTVSNNSQSTAYSCVLVDQLPAGVTFVSSSHSAVYDSVARTVTWQLGNVSPGTTISGWLTVQIGAVADNSVLTDTFNLSWKDHGGNAQGPATDSCDTTVHTHGQLTLTKEGPETAIPSQVYSYTLRVSNEGGLAAENSVLTDTLPGNVTYLSSSPAGIYSAGVVTWNLGTIEPGGTKTVTVTVQVDSSITNGESAINNASVAWPGGVPVDAVWETVLYSEPELTITKVGPEQATVDSTITYTGVLSNVGGSTAYDVILLDQLPSGVTFVSSSHSAVFDPAYNTVTWSLGDLPPGTSIPGWLTVHIEDSVLNNTVLTNSFNVTWKDGLDVPQGPVITTWDTTVYTHPLLTVEKSGPETAHPGSTVQYTLKVTNIGASEALNTELVDAIPVGLTYAASSPAGIESGDLVTWELGTVPAYGTVTITIDATVDSGMQNGATLINGVSLTWEDLLGRSFGPATSQAETTIYTLPQITISKTGPVTSYPGSSYSYTIKVCNAGGTAAEDGTICRWE